MELQLIGNFSIQEFSILAKDLVGHTRVVSLVATIKSVRLLINISAGA